MKRTRKIQSLIEDDMHQTLERMMFWDKVNGTTPHRSMSSYIRQLLQKEIDSRPEEDKQSIKNFKR